MKRYLGRIDFKGTHFHGWQRQPDVITVQSEVEKALRTLLHEEIRTYGCCRTDAGVHARNFAFHFDCPSALPERFHRSINALLPDAIALTSVQPVDSNFHARFHAVERSYRYFIHGRKDPFSVEISWHLPAWDRLDFDTMHTALELIAQQQEFYPFCKVKSGTNDYRCRIIDHHIDIDSSAKRMTIAIAATRFLRGMVRMIVGALIQVGLGKMHIEDIQQAFQHQQRLPKSLSAPAHGLFFTGVKYSQ